MPTDTVYGLAARLTKKSINKIYFIKKREKTRPLSLIIKNIDDLNLFTSCIPSFAKKIIKKFWPGPLTLVFEKNIHNPYNKIIGMENTIGIRIPKNNFVLNLLEKTGPLICTSANISGQVPPITLSKIPMIIKSKVGLIIDNGTIGSGIPSTIIDITSEDPLLIRVGSIKKENIECIIKKNIKTI